MLWLIIFIFILWVFYREILFVVCILKLRPQRIESRQYAVFVQAQKQVLPQIFIFEDGPFEALIFSQWTRSELLVCRPYWNSLSETEKDCLVSWAHSAARGTSLLQRLLGFFGVEKIDRQYLHWGMPALELVSILEKAKSFRHNTNSSVFDSPFAGLSLVGPSLFSDWISVEQRAQKIGLEASKIKISEQKQN